MYTSCPECGTVFRISTNDLRMAEGYARCGHCSTTFNAVASLSDEPPATVTLTQLQLPDPAQPEPEPSTDAPVTDDDVQDGGVGESEPMGNVSDDTLEFDIPEDNWSHFFESVFEGETQSKTRSEPASPEPAGDPPVEFDVGAGAGSDTVDQAGLYRALAAEKVPDTDDAPTAEKVPETGGDAEKVPDTGDNGDAGSDADWEALLEEVRDDDSPAEPVYVIGDTADEDALEAVADLVIPGPAWDEPESGDTLSPAPLPADFAPDIPLENAPADDAPATPGPPVPTSSIADQPFLWAPPVAPPAATRHHWGYAAGSVLAGIFLVVQLLHMNRDTLATRPSLTLPLQRAYAAAGLPLWPAWDLRSYEVRNSEAVADRSAVGALDILARIAVVGDERTGLPLVRVTLRDRSGIPVGTRVFEPDEYLGNNTRPPGPVAPGTIIPVEISLADPGPDAQGFDVDVCLMSRHDGITCRSEREPFAR